MNHQPVESTAGISINQGRMLVVLAAVFWSLSGAFTKILTQQASFQLDGRSYNALFSTDAEMIAVSRNILSSELPADLQTLLINHFSTCWISELVKYDIGGETKYYATVENANQRTILESFGGAEWSVLKETAK